MLCSAEFVVYMVRLCDVFGCVFTSGATTAIPVGTGGIDALGTDDFLVVTGSSIPEGEHTKVLRQAIPGAAVEASLALTRTLPVVPTRRESATAVLMPCMMPSTSHTYEVR